MHPDKRNMSDEKHPQYEKRCLQLAKEFGVQSECYADLPERFKQFFEVIGYSRVCSLMVISDLSRGRSERSLATKYGITRNQVETIKINSRLRKRRKDQ